MTGLVNDRLNRAIVGALDRGDLVPCLDLRDWPLWTSDDPDDRAEAAEACQGCPVLQVCRQAGAGERFGTWGGVDRSPKVGRPRKARDAT